MARLTQLRVGDEGFLVASLIERCPKTMMLRELVRNALEAAATAPAGERLVLIGSVVVDGTAKLAIRNTGRGMDGPELFAMADLASSIRKDHALDGNFGMGAKVAALPSNRLGLRYRSAHEGQVHEALLGFRDGAYGRVLQPDAAGEWRAVLDVTASLPPADADWTEVVLMGQHAAQDTLRDPYAGDPASAPDWLVRDLAARFFRIDPTVTLRLPDGGRFEASLDRLMRTAPLAGCVVLPDGTRLHYFGDDTEAPAPCLGSGALVHRDELFDRRDGDGWLNIAPIFGVPFAADRVAMFVELASDAALVPDGYRQFLRHRDGRQEQVSIRGHAAMLHANRPDWLIALIDRHALSARVGDDVQRTLGGLLRRLGVRRRARSMPSMVEPATGGGSSGEEGAPGSGIAGPDPAPGFEIEPVPEILLLRRPEDIAARGVIGRAGRYYPETHQLFLNAEYPAVETMRALLVEGSGDPVLGMRARALAEQAMAIRVGRMLVFGLARQGEWPDVALGHACAPEALSLAADDVWSNLDRTLAALRDAGEVRQGLCP